VWRDDEERKKEKKEKEKEKGEIRGREETRG